MSRDWTEAELRAASDAMERAGHMGYEEFRAEMTAVEKIMIFARRQTDYQFPCPRCGRWAMDTDPVRNALSRRVGVYICDKCGVEEALEDFAGKQMHLADWDIAKKEDWPLLP